MDDNIKNQILNRKEAFIFGASQAGKKVLQKIKSLCNIYTIIGFIDNDKKKQESKLSDINVYSPRILSKYDNNITILIASVYYKEIINQLQELGFCNYYVLFPYDENFYSALSDFKCQTKIQIYGRLLKINTQWHNNVSPELLDMHNKISKKIVSLFKKMTSQKINRLYKPGKFWGHRMKNCACDLFNSLYRNDVNKFTELIFEFRYFARELGICDESDALTFLQPDFSDYNYVENIIRAYDAISEVVDSKIIENISESEVGCPLSIQYKNKFITSEVIRHAYYLNILKIYIEKLNLLNNYRMIFMELGGGVGDTARQVKKYFNEKATYIIIDLPEVLSVSTYYLTMNFPNLKIGTFQDFINKKKISRKDLVEYDIILLPNYFIEKIDDLAVDIFLNTASLAEMESDIAVNYIRHIKRVCSGFFYSSNRLKYNFELGHKQYDTGINNYKFNDSHWTIIKNTSNLRIYNSIYPEYIDMIFIRKKHIK